MAENNPYEEFLEATSAPTMSVACKALTAFGKMGQDLEGHIDPARAKALLVKIFGDDAKYATIKDPDNLPETVTFLIDGIELCFWQGTVPEEDVFEVAYAGCLVMDNVRTLEGLGAAMASCIDLAQVSMDQLVKAEIQRDFLKISSEDEDLLDEDDFDDDEDNED